MVLELAGASAVVPGASPVEAETEVSTTAVVVNCVDPACGG